MIYAFGDIHATYEPLKEALSFVESVFSEGDRMVFLGDYIDRGGACKEVLDELMALKERRPETVFLMGNHEDLALRALETGLFDYFDIQDHKPRSLSHDASIWLNNGGTATLQCFGIWDPTPDSRLPEPYMDFLKTLSMEYRQGPYLFVHAGVLPPHIPMRAASEGYDPRLWVRDEFIQSPYRFPEVIVFGHTVFYGCEPHIRRDRLGIDTGSYRRNRSPVGKLTVACLDTDFSGTFGIDYIPELFTF